MPLLPHIKNSQVAQDIAEDVTMNRFNCLIQPPAGIPAPAWLSDEIKTIGGLDAIDKTPEMTTQKSRGHDRVFHGSFVDDTTLELSFTFNLNAHGLKANDIMIYKCMKSWRRRSRNESTGGTNLKRFQYGVLSLEQHNKIGEIWRQLDSPRVFLKELSGLDEASLEAGDPAELTVVFVLEEWDAVDGGDPLAL